MSKVLIITGGSKGIGNSLVNKYAEEGYRIYSLSRTLVDGRRNLKNISVDLSDCGAAVSILETILDSINLNKLTEILLINNAGSLGSISTIENNSTESIQKTIALNLSTPIALTSCFIDHLKLSNIKKRIVNISSGAAIKPYEGWTVYCSSKAGLDMATKTIAAEQNDSKNPVKINAIYPGVVETDMQTQIRETDKRDFKNVQRFIELKKDNKLFTPDYVANKIHLLDIENTLENGEIIDIRNI
jgi:benzil reductase ((S)-benzoin forming)